MTIEEAMREKAEVENAIRVLLEAFMRNTGMHVASVDVRTMTCYPVGSAAARMAPEVRLDVRL